MSAQLTIPFRSPPLVRTARAFCFAGIDGNFGVCGQAANEHGGGAQARRGVSCSGTTKPAAGIADFPTRALTFGRERFFICPVTDTPYVCPLVGLGPSRGFFYCGVPSQRQVDDGGRDKWRRDNGLELASSSLLVLNFPKSVRCFLSSFLIFFCIQDAERRFFGHFPRIAHKNARRVRNPGVAGAVR